jgi:cytochrome c-type biogenesis protein CcmH/NrfG
MVAVHSVLCLFFLLASDLERGIQAAEDGKHDLAITCFTAHLREHPKDPAAYFKRGVSYLEKDELDNAMADFNLAIRLDPGSADNYVYRGLVYCLSTEFDQAIPDFNEAIRLDPKSADAYSVRAYAYSRKGDSARAIPDFRKELRLKPPIYSLDLLGAGYLGEGEFEMAIAAFREMLRVDPKNVNACNLLAWILATCPKGELRNGKEAVRYAKQGCERTEWNDPALLDTLAAAHAENGDFAEAVKWQRKALEHPQCRDDQKEPARKRLKLYQEGKPWRD